MRNVSVDTRRRRPASFRVVALTAVVAISLAAGTAEADARPKLAAAPAAQTAPPFITTALRNVTWKFLVRRVGIPVAKGVFTSWLASKAEECPDWLPRVFCKYRPAGVRGVAITRNIAGAVVWAEPAATSSGQRLHVRANAALALTCWTVGRQRTTARRPTIWYRTIDGWYAYSRLLYTGVDGLVPSVPRC
jgi:hypothetical protein